MISISSHEEHLMHMLQYLFYIEALHKFLVKCVQLPGSLNGAVDALLCNVLPSFPKANCNRA